MTGPGRGKPGLDRPTRLYVLAVFGLHMAFMPVLVLLLPRRTASLFGSDAASALSWLLLAGALTASIANIAAGFLGDRWVKHRGSRRGLIAIGLAALICSYGLLAFAVELAWLIPAIIAFQIGLNMALGPTMALLADHIASSRKGLVAGWMGTALPLSAMGTAALGLAFPADDNAAFFATAAIVALCVVPLLTFWGFAPASLHSRPTDPASEPGKAVHIPTISLLWVARALVQFAACFVLYYLFLHITGLIADDTAWHSLSGTFFISFLSLMGASVAVPTAVFSGLISDRLRSRQSVMALSALVLALSLYVLGSRPSPQIFAVAFVLFQLFLSAYLSVDTALIAQLTGHHPRRGAILGAMNLTNTLPAVLAPLLTIQAMSLAGGEMPYDLIYMYCALGLLVATIAVLRSASD